MFHVKELGLLFTLSIVATTATAGTVIGIASDVQVRATDGLTYDTTNGAASGQPACATHDYWMIMNENSAAGNKQFAMLLAARASGQSVTITGVNTCTRWPDGEDISAMDLNG